MSSEQKVCNGYYVRTFQSQNNFPLVRERSNKKPSLESKLNLVANNKVQC